MKWKNRAICTHAYAPGDAGGIGAVQPLLRQLHPDHLRVDAPHLFYMYKINQSIHPSRKLYIYTHTHTHGLGSHTRRTCMRAWRCTALDTRVRDIIVRASRNPKTWSMVSGGRTASNRPPALVVAAAGRGGVMERSGLGAAVPPVAAAPTPAPQEGRRRLRHPFITAVSRRPLSLDGSTVGGQHIHANKGRWIRTPWPTDAHPSTHPELDPSLVPPLPPSIRACLAVADAEAAIVDCTLDRPRLVAVPRASGGT